MSQQVGMDLPYADFLPDQAEAHLDGAVVCFAATFIEKEEFGFLALALEETFPSAQVAAQMVSQRFR